MIGKITICDNCKKESRQMEGGFGVFGTYNWITVSRCSSNGNTIISAGVYHFCCDECLVEWINKPSEKLSKNNAVFNL